MNAFEAAELDSNYPTRPKDWMQLAAELHPSDYEEVVWQYEERRADALAKAGISEELLHVLVKEAENKFFDLLLWGIK